MLDLITINEVSPHVISGGNKVSGCLVDNVLVNMHDAPKVSALGLCLPSKNRQLKLKAFCSLPALQ